MGSRAAAFAIALVGLAVLVVIVLVITLGTHAGAPVENAPPGAGSSTSP
ncbi:MAG: hypothetical protein M3295_02620 [Chloroflexota bacterium]|nr:hypothetical protein [Chloroflexota bacterium]